MANLLKLLRVRAQGTLLLQVCFPGLIVLTPEVTPLGLIVGLRQLVFILDVVPSVAWDLVGQLKELLLGIKRLEVRRLLELDQELCLLDDFVQDLGALCLLLLTDVVFEPLAHLCRVAPLLEK